MATFQDNPGISHVSILDFIRAKDDWDGDDNWRYDLQSSSQIVTISVPTPNFLQCGWPSGRPKKSVKALKAESITFYGLAQPKLTTSRLSCLCWPLKVPGYFEGVATPLVSNLMRVPRAESRRIICFLPSIYKPISLLHCTVIYCS